MFWFAFASLSPLALLAASATWANEMSWLPWLALLNQTLLVFGLDQIGRRNQVREPGVFADLLSVCLALGHILVLYPVLDAALNLPVASGFALLLSFALFMGQISHPNAHELIHHPSRGMRRLGLLVYCSMLFGHHVSAHLKVHHILVATKMDPNTARQGEGFYRFFPRAWIGSLRAGLAAENQARARREKPASPLSHPYLVYSGGAVLTLGLACLVGGIAGLGACLFVAFYAQVQILLADYVQHYGLHRKSRADGRPEPVGPAHSWNAPHWYSSSMMLNAPRHSDHHLSPKRRYPELRLEPAMPLLPYSLPVMAVLALFPPLWRRVMNRTIVQQSIDCCHQDHKA